MWNLFRRASKTDNSFPPKIERWLPPVLMEGDILDIDRMNRSAKFIKEILEDVKAGDRDDIYLYNISVPMKSLLLSQINVIIDRGDRLMNKHNGD